MKSILIILILITTSNLYAENCVMVKEKDVKIGWTAFKTPAKVGVEGSFSSFKLERKKGTSPKDLAYGMGINIDATSVNTGNKARDKKIAKYFFETISGGKRIKARVTKIDDKYMTLDISMNGKARKVPMSYTILGNELKAQGFIDVLDFALSKELKSINKACYTLHEGKTWSDVGLDLTVQFSPCK